MTRIANFLGAVLIACALLAATQPGPSASQATPGVDLLNAVSRARIEFPTGISISASVQVEHPTDEAWLELVYHFGTNETLYLAATPMKTVAGPGTVEITAWLDLQAQYIPPGVFITYQWRLTGTEGTIAASGPETTRWQDDRWDWHDVVGDHVHLHYHGLDAGFAAEVLSAAETTIGEIEARFGVAPTSVFELWVYPSQAAFRDALVPNSRETMVAATYPDFSVMLAVVPNGNRPEIARVIPHEIAHLVLFQATDNPFTYLPLWFNEGLATHVQTGGTSGYMGMVIAAWERDALYSLTSIDVTFPYTAYEATLAYAASWSAIEFMRLAWGDEGIARLIEAYASGVPWDEAIQIGLGVSMAEFDQGWRDWIESESLEAAA